MSVKQRKSNAATFHYASFTMPLIIPSLMERVQCSAKRRKMRFTHSIHLSLLLHFASHSRSPSLCSDAIVTLLAPSDWLQSTGDRSEQNSSRTQPYASRFDVTAMPIIQSYCCRMLTTPLSLSLSTLALSLSVSSLRYNSYL